MVGVSGNVNVGEYSLIGTGTSVQPGVTIGNNVKIGIGSKVYKNLADNTVFKNLTFLFMTTFLPSLGIPGLIWVPFFPDLIVSLSSLIFLVYVFKNKLFFYFTKKPLIIFLFFASIVFL